MIQWIITSSVLILIVIMLRFILRGKISLKLQYALWLVVLIRLIVPVALFESPISVMNVFSKIDTKQITETVSAENEHEIVEDSDIIYTEYENTAPVSENILQNPNVDGNEVTKPAEQSFKFPEITAEGVWILGAAMTAMALLASNITFTAQLKRTRQPIATANTPLPVYFSPAVITPCMFGMFKPSIYVTETALSDDKIFSHVIAHETTHWKHRDNIWAILRCAALALHWYNPLVWVAAFLSLRDAELACDEDTIKEIGEDERVDYGRTLISLTTKKPMAGIMSTATTMTGSKNGIKERIMLIAKKPKVLKITVAVLILAVAAAMVVTFSSPLMKRAEEQETVVAESTYGSCVERDGKFYVLDLDGNITGGPFDTMEYYSPEDGDKFMVFSNIGENNRREIVFNSENRAEWIETEDIEYTLYQMNFRKVNDIPFTSYYSYGYDPTTGAELSGVSDGVQYGYVFDRKTATYSLQSKAGDYTDFVSGNYDENNLVKSGDYYLLQYYYNANIFRPVFGLGDKNGNVILEPRYNNISVLLGDRFLVREGEGAEQGDICGRSYIVDLTGKKLGNEYNDLEYIQLTNGWFIGIAKSYGSASEVELLDNSGENMNNEYWFGYWFVDGNGMPISDKYNEIRVYDDCFVKKDGKYLLDANSSVDVLSLKDAWISISAGSYAIEFPGNAQIFIYIEPWQKKLTSSELKKAQDALKGMVLNSDGTVSLSETAPFLNHYYSNVGKIDLSAFLEYCPDSGTLESGKDDKEFTALNEKCNRFPENATLASVPVPVHRYKASDINALLLKYAGIGIEDVKNDPRNLEHSSNVCYLEEYDCYYNFTSDSSDFSFYCDAGDASGNKVRLFQYDKNHKLSGGGVTILTLQKYKGEYYFLSHKHYDSYIIGDAPDEEEYESNPDTEPITENLNAVSSGIHVGAVLPFDKFVYPTIKEERLATEENIEEFENALSDFGLVSWIEITETADDISRNLTGTEVKRIYDILSTAELEIFDEHPNPNTGGALFIRGVKKNGKTLWTLCYDFGNMVRICLDGETNYAFEVDRDAFKEIRTILEGSEVEGDVLRTKRGIFESTNPAKALPEVYACGNISLYSGDGKYFYDYGECTGQYGFDFSNTIYDEAIETKTEYLGSKLKTVKTVEIVDKTDSTKFNINLYEFGFTLDGSAVEKLKAAGSDFAEAYTMDSFIWRNAVAGIEEKYLSAEDYGICWLGLIQPKRVESITVKDSVTGGEQKFTHNDGNHDEIAPIVDILRGLKAADEEHPYKNSGSISIDIKFKTGISYNIEYYNGAIEIYADDLKKSVSYCVKDFEGVYNKLLKYALGEYEYNYTVG